MLLRILAIHIHNLLSAYICFAYHSVYVSTLELKRNSHKLTHAVVNAAGKAAFQVP